MSDINNADQQSAMDYNEHEKTFALFMGMFKYGSMIVLGILVLMALFLLPSH